MLRDPKTQLESEDEAELAPAKEDRPIPVSTAKTVTPEEAKPEKAFDTKGKTFAVS